MVKVGGLKRCCRKALELLGSYVFSEPLELHINGALSKQFAGAATG